jgi:hypothetical protein
MGGFSFASTGSESELNGVLVSISRISSLENFPDFCDTVFRVFFHIYYADSLLYTSRFHNFKYNSNVQS